MIYFLLDEDERLIEIGAAEHVNSRLAQRRGVLGDALRLLAVIEGDLPEAETIRERFSALRVRDDWYRTDTALAEFIVRAGHPWAGGMPTGTPVYRDRLADLAVISGIPEVTLVELALSAWADRNGFADELASKGGSGLPRVVEESDPDPGDPVAGIGR